MSIDQIANQEYERALNRGFWRKILTRITGTTNELLPFDEVRAKLPIQGQHYAGLQQVPIEKIIGSFGRYHDFDRIFLPIQKKTRNRWVSIDRAHLYQIPLPPVDLYKLGEVYFVKDGNHRISVAREQGQLEIDAFITEVDIPVNLTIETTLDDIQLKQEYADFLIRSELLKARSDANIEISQSGLYDEMLLDIEVHHWFLKYMKGEDVSFQAAVVSWYDNIYIPIIKIIREKGLLDLFPNSTEADIAILMLSFVSYMRILESKSNGKSDPETRLSAGRHLIQNFPIRSVRKLVNELNKTDWVDSLLLQQEKALFIEMTGINEVIPEAEIGLTIPGLYKKIQDHISVHRWYLGEKENIDVSRAMALTSWYDNVYLPIVKLIREQKILKSFPGRTEADLYLWIIEHHYYLSELSGDKVSYEEAVENFSAGYAKGNREST